METGDACNNIILGDLIIIVIIIVTLLNGNVPESNYCVIITISVELCRRHNGYTYNIYVYVYAVRELLIVGPFGEGGKR